MTKRKICWLLVLVFLFLLLADRTSAHAYLVRSDPAANQRVSSNINNVRIQFNEPIQPTFFTLAVVDQNGRRVDAHQARIDKRRRNALQNTVKTPLAEGFYRIKWKMISADGHPVDGTIAFQVGHPNTRSNQAPALTAGNDWPGVDRIVIKWMLYGGLSLYLSILVFFTLIYRRRDPFIFNISVKPYQLIIGHFTVLLLKNDLFFIFCHQLIIPLQLIIVKSGSFQSAAKRLNYSQPTVSMRIKQLEEDLGITLFHRGKALKLTQAGQLFYKRAEQLLSQYEVLDNTISDLRKDEELYPAPG